MLLGLKVGLSATANIQWRSRAVNFLSGESSLILKRPPGLRQYKGPAIGRVAINKGVSIDVGGNNIETAILFYRSRNTVRQT